MRKNNLPYFKIKYNHSFWFTQHLFTLINLTYKLGSFLYGSFWLYTVFIYTSRGLVVYIYIALLLRNLLKLDFQECIDLLPYHCANRALNVLEPRKFVMGANSRSRCKIQQTLHSDIRRCACFRAERLGYCKIEFLTASMFSLCLCTTEPVHLPSEVCYPRSMDLRSGTESLREILN